MVGAGREALGSGRRDGTLRQCYMGYSRIRIRNALGSYRGTSLIRNTHPPQVHHRSLVIGLLQGPMGGVLMSEVPLYGGASPKRKGPP
jgi:hypothetical protein